MDIIIPIITGVVADKLGNFRSLLQIMTAVNGSSCLFFYFVSPNNFAQYLTVRLMFDVTRSASLSLSEGTLSLMVRKLKMDYGRQRVLSSLAPMLVTPLAGLLLDLDQESKYFTLFAFYFALKVASVAVTFCLDLTFKKQSKLVLYNIKDLLSKRSILRFLTIFATLGAVWGIIETYLYLYLNQIGISKQNIGFSQSISTVTGVLLTIYSTNFLKTLRYDLVVILIFSAYAVRFLGHSYNLLPQPYWCFTLEMFKPLGNNLAMVTATHFILANSDNTNIASLEGLFGSCYFGIGKALGILFGGSLSSYFGYEVAWKIFGYLCGVVAMLHYGTSKIRRKIKTV